MEVITGDNEIIRIELEEERVTPVKTDVYFYKRIKGYTIAQIGNYLEIASTAKKTRLHLYRDITDVQIIKDRVILIGEDWLESFEEGVLKKERETKKKVLDTKTYRDLLFVLHSSYISILDKRLKQIEKLKIPVEYPEEIFIYEKEDSTGVIGILSKTKKTIYLFSTKGNLTKKITYPHSPLSFSIFTHKESLYLTAAYKTTIQTDNLTKGSVTTAETDHISPITQVIYSKERSFLYTVSKEGILCEVSPEEKEARAVYVDRRGVKKIVENE